jgi:4-diphosphocytidyl-2C-methyl-D-erythritol kinase
MPVRKTFAASLLALTVALGAGPGHADGNAGAYLAARIAATDSDYRAAAEYFTRALVLDPSNLGLMEGALSSFVSAGDTDRAIPIARRIIQTAPESQLANLVLIARAAEVGDWESLLADLGAGQSVGPLFDGLARAWALVGAGRVNDALAAFDEVAANPGVGAFGLYHKALALASVGDFEGAADMFSGAAGPQVRLTRRGNIAFAEVLSQIDRGAEGAEILDRAFGPNPDGFIAELRRQLAAGAPLPYSGITSAREGIAEAAFSIAGALNGEAADAYTLIYVRIAQYLDPSHVDAVLLAGGLLDNLGQYGLSAEVYGSVSEDHPFFPVAEIGRAHAMRDAGDPDGAIAVLEALATAHPDLGLAHVTLGDMLRREERFAEATLAYDRAIALIRSEEEAQWIVYFSRGITHEREDRWPEAEADFRKALELSPRPAAGAELPRLFLRRDADEPRRGAAMIERAVAAQPESGYIVDSLGWVLYRLGRYDEALVQMERAVELLPVDPVVNDHLGDVYWAVGRKREAEFQWHRALSFIGMGESNDATARPHPPQARDRARRGSWPRRARRRSGSRMTTVRVFAPAKVNLTLHVIGRRADGYHLLDSLVTFADVGDELLVAPGRGGLTLTVRGPEAAGVPADATNLALKAAAILAEERGAAVDLVKNLPAASGIGGGSADAAAALRAMMALRGIGRTALATKAADLGAQAREILALGADVPMCLFPRPLRARGIGERVDAVALPTVAAVLVNPRLPVSTPEVFRTLDRRDNAPMPERLPALGDSAVLAEWLGGQRNDLEAAAIRVQPVVATVLAALGATQGCLLARMSGSGATCFGIYGSPSEAARAAARIRAERPGWWVTETLLGDQTARAVPVPA